VLERVDSPMPAILHLHHLTPLHEAAMQRWPGVPVVTHLHGTEMLMLEQITTAAPASWRYSGYWLDRLRVTAHRSSHLLALSTDHADRAVDVLGVPPDRVTVVPNGVDTDQFRPLHLSVTDRLALLRRWLVDDPQGWDASGRPGSIRYQEADLEAFSDGHRLRPVLLFVGRFMAVKRLPLLLSAYARVRQRLGPVAPLLIWGGYPGEWEGTHPAQLAGQQDGVFFLGWRGHDELPLGLACADVLVAPSVGEAFGAVYLEAMAAGLPVVATRTGGPATYLDVADSPPLGWLVEPDDEVALADVLVEALTDPQARQTRGAAGMTVARQRFSWRQVAAAVDDVYSAVLNRGLSAS
jgi:glycosyltransferase involved in cell wall biosynthesis